MMFDREFYVEKIASNMEEFLTSARIRSIMLDIIEMKQENRNIGDKVRSFEKHIDTNTNKMYRVQGHAYVDWYKTYEDRIIRDLTTVEYLQKLQEYNSKLINKHRSKVKSLRSELQELKKELNDTKGEKQ